MKKIIYILLISILLPACSGPKLIPEKELESIITQSLLSDATWNRVVSSMSHDQRRQLDSADIYAPILKKYGYTTADFQYTVTTLAVRKSNPLDNIFKNASEEIERYEIVASAKYREYLKMDTIARNYFADTIFKDNSTIIGPLKNYKKLVFYKIQPGRYEIRFEYKSITDKEIIGSKTIKYEATDKDPNLRAISTFWLSRSSDQVQSFRQEIPLKTKFDTLRFTFNDIKIEQGKNFKDTSMVRNIRVIYYPESAKARQDYFHAVSGIPSSYKEYHDKRFPNLSDSITIPFEPGRQFGEEWSGGVRSSKPGSKRNDKLSKYRYVTPDDIP